MKMAFVDPGTYLIMFTARFAYGLGYVWSLLQYVYL